MSKRKTRQEKTEEHLKQLEIEKSLAKPVIRRTDTLAYIIMIFGFAAFLHFHSIGECTIVGFFALVKLALLPTILVMMILYWKWNDEDYLWEDLYVVFFMSGLLCFFFSICIIYINYYTIKSEYIIEKVIIQEKSIMNRSKRGPRVPAATIEYLDQEITLKFDEDEFERMHHARYLLIDVKKGNLGFGVIKRFDIDDGQKKWR